MLVGSGDLNGTAKVDQFWLKRVRIQQNIFVLDVTMENADILQSSANLGYLKCVL